MPRGVKRTIKEDIKKEISPLKKTRVDDVDSNGVDLDEMKKAQEENRRRVRDMYLREQNLPIPAEEEVTKSKPRRETISSVSSSRTPPAARRSSTGSKSTANAKTPAEKKPPKSPNTDAKVSKPRKPTPKTTPKSTKADSPSVASKSTAKKPAVKKTESKKVAEVIETNTVNKVISSEIEEGNDDEDWCGKLYPSIAFSDAINAIGHLCAAFIAIGNGNELAGVGFLSVWLAAIVGVLRFGVSEKLFEQPNKDLASFAAFVGYPLIGLSFAKLHYQDLKIRVELIGFVLVAWESLTRSFVEKNKELAKLATNIIFFVGPVAMVCHETKDMNTVGALLAFVLAGVAITPHHEDRILGIRCVDWFHVIIAGTAFIFANGLGRLA